MISHHVLIRDLCKFRILLRLKPTSTENKANDRKYSSSINFLKVEGVRKLQEEVREEVDNNQKSKGMRYRLPQ